MHRIMGVGEVIFRFAMLNIPLRGAHKFTERPSKTTYLQELGLSYPQKQKLLKKSTWARRYSRSKLVKFRENPDLGQDSSSIPADLVSELTKSEQNEKKVCTSSSEHEAKLEETVKNPGCLYKKACPILFFFCWKFLISEIFGLKIQTWERKT